MDANIDQKMVYNLNRLSVGYNANIASKRPETWRGVPDSRFFGLEGSWMLLEAFWRSLGGLSGPKR
eukprot:1299228-Karenia_brevis.AAC.1